MASDNADLDSVMKSLCSMSRDKDDSSYVKLLDVAEQLRQVLLEDVNNPLPAVLNNDVVFRSVFCFLLGPRRAVDYLDNLGRNAITSWSSVIEMEPLEFVQKIRTRSSSADENTAVIVLFVLSVLRLSVTTTDTLDVAKEARVRTSKKVWDGWNTEDRISEVQRDLNRDLISCMHLQKLMPGLRVDEEPAICDEETRQMFAGFAILAQLVYDHGDYSVLEGMMKLSVAVFELMNEVVDAVLDIRSDISPRFLPQTIKSLLADDPELSYSVPFRMYRHYMHVQMELKARCGEPGGEWSVDQQLNTANHYCGDEGMVYYDGRYAFMCWLLYGLSLFDCGRYAEAEVILKMDYLKTTGMAVPSSKTAGACLRRCRSEWTAGEHTTPKQSLLYFSASPVVAQPTTVWHSIYDDPAVRKYFPRHIPDYAEICRRLVRSDELTEDKIHSLVLESIGPLIDLAYQPKKPKKIIRHDKSINIYGGSVNESLDVQSHVHAGASTEEEVPDIDMMMAVSPSELSLDVTLESSAISPRYAYLVNSKTGERFQSFSLLVDTLPVALNKVAKFVADPAFAQEYEILSIAVHGPAVATKIRRGGDTILNYDHVPAFYIESWPEVAEEWKTRKRQFGWPSASVIEQIVQDGVFVVAVCHPSSTDPLNEWRISFTVAERVLIDTLTGAQRLAYLYAKLIWMSSLKSSSFLVSYHLKNALLWLCEERPSEFWKGDNLVACVGDIFRWFRQEISNRHLRNYFIPSDSMIPMWVESTDELIQSLDRIIGNVFQVRQCGFVLGLSRLPHDHVFH